MRTVKGALVAAVCLLAAGGHAQDVEKGKAIFNQCMACHQLDSNMVGPKLRGVIGRKAGSAEGYDHYSPLMKTAGDAGLTWTAEEIADYLKNPTEYLTKYDKGKGKEPSGVSRMLYKLANEEQRRDVASFLASAK